jgi:UDP-glucose:(heptosyl)LPS alpha-1,3-glucosyltransferase
MPVIFNGVDPDPADRDRREEDRWELRRRYRLADDELLLLTVAHNFKLKGVSRLIEAVARLKAERPRLKFRALTVGRDDPGPYAEWADQLGVSDRIIFAGDVNRIETFYHAADVLVHPTYYDPCSRVVLEALAAGLPVVTTRYNGAAERVADGRQGFVIDDPGDVAALADRIGRLADDNLRRQCSEEAAAVVESLTMERHARQVVDLYRQVFAEGAWKQGGYR